MLQLSELEAQLVEIDENLVRNDLTVLERAESVARRKEIYEALHPLAKPEEQRKKGLNVSADKLTALAETPAFTKDTAEKAKISERTVRRDVQVATKLAPEVKEAIRALPVADSQTELLQPHG